MAALAVLVETTKVRRGLSSKWVSAWLCGPELTEFDNMS